MQIALLTALGVGGATLIGAVLGFIFKKVSHRFNDIVLSFAAGIMLCAAVLGLILPAMESGGDFAVLVTILGVFSGAVVLNLADHLTPHLHRLVGTEFENHPESTEHLNKLFLFVLAIAIHNFPEGIAAGVGFGSGNTAEALTIAGGIALQNIPEGMVVIAPLLSMGISPKRALITASLTGLVEVIGTLIGFFAISVSTAILPFALSFAGGTMLYIISDEMIPETHSHNNERHATYALLVGFCVMLLIDHFVG